MINTILLAGEIKKLTISEPKNPSKGASAVMLIQYGVQRESTNGSVEFVNAALVRVPSYKFPKLRSSLSVGKYVHITGHLQGVFKNAADQGFFSVELVADRIDVLGKAWVEAPEASSAGDETPGEAPEAA